MLLSITSTTPEATDLGFVLHKHPDRVRTQSVGLGTAHVFYPEASPQRCTATLLVEVDPISLSRRRKGAPTHNLEPYVNDRPYVASSILSGALRQVYGSALAGRCDARPELVDRAIDLDIELPAVPVRGGEPVLHRLFGPLGYEIDGSVIELDPQFPTWGDSSYVRLRLRGHTTVQRALQHLYVLLPVLDDRKHHWIGSDEVDKLLRRGESWLGDHPERELIARRYLRFGGLAREALTRLSENAEDIDAADEANDEAEAAAERPLSLNEQRMTAVTAAVLAAGGGAVVDLGCGEGRLLQALMRESSITKLVGVDVSIGSLERAERRLRLDQLSERRRQRISLLQGALTYTDDRLTGFDVACVVEVIEHIDAERLDVFARVLFGHLAPTTVIVTTPNVEYNVNFEGMAPGSLRHRDHRFEWTRAELREWAASVADRYGYTVRIDGIGPEDAATGCPTQMAVFRRGEGVIS